MAVGQEYHFSMRRPAFSVFALAVAVVLAFPAAAQGPPASVTSPGFGGRFSSSPGVPASVTSPGFGKTTEGFRSHHPFPNQPNCCINPLFPSNGNGRGHHRGNRFPATTPIFIPYYTYPQVIVDAPVDDSLEQMRPQDQYLGGPTIFDRRGPGTAQRPEPAREAERPREQERELESEPVAHSAPAPAADQPETLLVFKDGRQLEVQNYAIVGSTLYDMTPGHPRKVLLADLDLDATTKENDNRGIDFRLPPGAVAE